MSYEIKIPLFKGPFDLLLFFIERDEIDIVDIPISQITKNFLEYISNLKKMNIEVASEFIVVAATLMRIKSKMLLHLLQLCHIRSNFRRILDIWVEFREITLKRSQKESYTGGVDL